MSSMPSVRPTPVLDGSVWERIFVFFSNLDLVKRFTIASFVVMILGMFGIGRWVALKIEDGVIRENAAATALYMDGFISPHLQHLADVSVLTGEDIEALDSLLKDTGLGSQTVSFKIWSSDHHIIYSNNPNLIGRNFAPTADLLAAWEGNVTAEISLLQDDENVEERLGGNVRLLEVYSPVRVEGADRVIAVAEFYRDVESLDADIAAAQRESWYVVGAAMGVIYLLLVGYVRYASATIEQQELELKGQVEHLQELLAHNATLNQRVRRAAANATAFNERFLRRTSAELHDGPIQEIELALGRLERVKSQNETCRLITPNVQCTDHLPSARGSLSNALEEIRAIAAGLTLPQLEYLTLTELIARVVRAHENQTGTRVMLSMNDLPQQTPLEIKITAYRVIQEALNNAHNHAGGEGQQVRARYIDNIITVEISDNGPGFDVEHPAVEDGGREHLGLAGMRERVESLGGSFTIESVKNQGTRLVVALTLQDIGENIHG